MIGPSRPTANATCLLMVQSCLAPAGRPLFGPGRIDHVANDAAADDYYDAGAAVCGLGGLGDALGAGQICIMVRAGEQARTLPTTLLAPR